MARLIVEAVSGETAGSDLVGHLQALVSVSHSETGLPVTGLSKEHFRICSTIGAIMDPKVGFVTELKWEPRDTEPSGIYKITIQRELGTPFGDSWAVGVTYGFGIQVRLGDLTGQTVLAIESLGR